jgi:hypothetical protein
MVRIAAAPLLALLAAAACSEPQVVREGPGWREVQASPQETRVELTSSDPKELAVIARTHADPKLRAAAVGKIDDQAVLADVAKADADPRIRVAAVGRLADRGALAAIAQSDADESVRTAASERRDLIRFVAPGGPEHAGWAGRSPGSWVLFKAQLKVGERASNVDVHRTLVRCSPAGAVLEQRDFLSKRPLQGLAREMLDRSAAPAGTRQEDEESAEAGGRRLKCRTVRWSAQYGRVIARVKFWLSEEVPGGVARIDVEESPEGEPLRSLRAQLAQWGD